MTREQLQQIRDAMVKAEPIHISDEDYENALRILDAAIAEPEPEPVAWVAAGQADGQAINGKPRRVWWECVTGVGMPIYTTPPAAKHDVLAALRECLAELKAHNESAYCELRGGFDDVIERAENALARNTGEQA